MNIDKRFFVSHNVAKFKTELNPSLVDIIENNPKLRLLLNKRVNSILNQILISDTQKIIEKEIESKKKSDKNDDKLLEGKNPFDFLASMIEDCNKNIKLLSDIFYENKTSFSNRFIISNTENESSFKVLIKDKQEKKSYFLISIRK